MLLDEAFLMRLKGKFLKTLTVYILEKLVLTLDKGFAQDARMIMSSNERDRRRQRTGKGENMTISIIHRTTKRYTRTRIHYESTESQ